MQPVTRIDHFALGHDGALGHGHVPACHTHDQAHVLFDQKQCCALFCHLIEDDGQLVHDHRGQPFGGLVQQDQGGVGHQRTTDRQHLLLPPRQRCARCMGSLLQNREEFVDFGHRPAAFATDRGTQNQVLLHGEVGHNAPPLRYHGDAMLRRHIGPQFGVLLSAKCHMTRGQAGQPQDGVDHGGLADTVASDEGHAFARIHLQVQAVQDVRRTIVGVHVFQTQQGAHAALPK